MVVGDRGLSEWRFVGRNHEGVSIEVDGCDLFVFARERIQVKDSFRKLRTGG
jgi:hypothetical protein